MRYLLIVILTLVGASSVRAANKNPYARSNADDVVTAELAGTYFTFDPREEEYTVPVPIGSHIENVCHSIPHTSKSCSLQNVCHDVTTHTQSCGDETIIDYGQEKRTRTVIDKNAHVFKVPVKVTFPYGSLLIATAEEQIDFGAVSEDHEHPHFSFVIKSPSYGYRIADIDRADTGEIEIKLAIDHYCAEKDFCSSTIDTRPANTYAKAASSASGLQTLITGPLF